MIRKSEDEDCVSQATIDETFRRVWDRFDAIEKSIAVAYESLKEYKRENNEYRGMVGDQRAAFGTAMAEQRNYFAPRDTMDQAILRLEENINEKVKATNSRLDTEMGALHAKIGVNEQRLRSLENSNANNEGRIWAVGAVIVIINVAIAIAGFFIKTS